MNDIDYSVILPALPFLLDGLQYTIQLTVVACIGGILLGTLLAVARLSTYRPLALAAAMYVNLMRSVPLLLVIFWFYFLAPMLVQALTGAERPVQVGPDRTAYVTFVLFEAAYFCEILRAGIKSVGQGQLNAAFALGLTYNQAMRSVVLPQAFRNMTPVLLTQAIILFQDTSLVYVLSVTDFLGAASKIAERDGRLVEMYTFVALSFYLMCYALSRAVKLLHARIAIIR